jgi:hypothetical protein
LLRAVPDDRVGVGGHRVGVPRRRGGQVAGRRG